MHRYANKRDKNESRIIEALRAAGASVTPLSAPGVPDLLVGFRGQTYLLEVKDGRNGLTDEQDDWHTNWRGSPVWIVRNLEESLRAISAVQE